jgi:multiple sugar transport system permease protein
MFNQYAGGLNKVLSIFGIKPVQWLGYEYVFYALIIMLTWGSTGSLLINLSALKNVPAELYEAASIDGANGFQKFRKITIPMISPVLFFNLIMGIIGSMQLYTQPVLLASGNNGVLNRPLKPIYTFMVHAYQQILGYSRFGYGLAMIWILVIVINIMTVIVMKSQKYWVYYGD